MCTESSAAISALLSEDKRAFSIASIAISNGVFIPSSNSIASIVIVGGD